MVVYRRGWFNWVNVMDVISYVLQVGPRTPWAAAALLNVPLRHYTEKCTCYEQWSCSLYILTLQLSNGLCSYSAR